jgi:hypothetical protein
MSCCAAQNALVPVLVRGQLSNHSVERLAAGMSHVAVVATQRTKTNSGSGSTQLTRLLTWGKNTAGQLGIGAGREDHFMPQVWLQQADSTQPPASCGVCKSSHIVEAGQRLDMQACTLGPPHCTSACITCIDLSAGRTISCCLCGRSSRRCTVLWWPASGGIDCK